MRSQRPRPKRELPPLPPRARSAEPIAARSPAAPRRCVATSPSRCVWMSRGDEGVSARVLLFVSAPAAQRRGHKRAQSEEQGCGSQSAHEATPACYLATTCGTTTEGVVEGGDKRVSLLIILLLATELTTPSIGEHKRTWDLTPTGKASASHDASALPLVLKRGSRANLAEPGARPGNLLQRQRVRAGPALQQTTPTHARGVTCCWAGDDPPTIVPSHTPLGDSPESSAETKDVRRTQRRSAPAREVLLPRRPAENKHRRLWDRRGRAETPQSLVRLGDFRSLSRAALRPMVGWAPGKHFPHRKSTAHVWADASCACPTALISPLLIVRGSNPVCCSRSQQQRTSTGERLTASLE